MRAGGAKYTKQYWGIFFFVFGLETDFLQELLTRTGNLNEASRAELDILCSFTIPATLLASGSDSLEQHMQRWLEGVASSVPDQDFASCSNLAGLFCRASMDFTPVRHRVAL